MDDNNQRELILKTLIEKLPAKHSAYLNAKETFALIKTELKLLSEEMCSAAQVEKGILVKYKEKGAFECELSFGEDILIFYLHADVCDLAPAHSNWKSSYLKGDRLNAFCGMIGIFNFLSNSFRFSRHDDIGYMIGRIFVNQENHFFLEGKRQLGFLYNDFMHAEIDQPAARSIVESAVSYCLEFDLLSPPFNDVIEVRVGDMIEQNQRMKMKTGKRLGFRFEADTDRIE